MKMCYFVVGTNNMPSAVEFYDALFAITDYRQTFADHRMTFWQGADSDSAFAVALPFDKKEATHGNGTMLGFSLGSPELVDAVYQKALDLGGTCEGKPGQRGPRYSAYVRDRDHNKLVFSD